MSHRGFGLTAREIDVTVIIAIRNGAEHLRGCIDSVVSQAGCEVEIIAVDGLSEDGTDRIVDSYGTSIDVRIREADRGVADAWNKGLARARGTWCFFLGADDRLLHPQALRGLLDDAMMVDPAPAFVAGGIVQVALDREYVVHPSPRSMAGYLRNGRMLPHQGMLLHVASLRRVGGFDASLKVASDFDAALRLLVVGVPRHHDGVVAAMRLGGISDQRDLRSRWEHLKERFVVLRRHRRAPVAALWLAFFEIRKGLGEVLEGTLVTVLGRRVGAAMTIRIRRRLGLRERLRADR